ncbi:MAG: 1-hydroxycarotenoid 3,4-desaturase CrtD [Bacteroidales bacterium]
MNSNTLRAIIIGAGVAGLASAIRLARRGFSVGVLEAGALPGGKMSEIRRDGFRFDTGPSLFTLPHLVAELLDDVFYEKYHRLELVTRYFWDDGIVLNAWARPEQFAAEMETVLGVPARQVLSYLDEARFLYEHTEQMFIFNPVNQVRTLLSRTGLKALRALPKLKAFRSLHHENLRWFSHPKAVQLFDRFATYNGSNPYLAPATLRMIPHLEHNLGVWFPKEGMHQIARDLESKARSLGAAFYYEEPAIEILFEGSKATAVKTEKRTLQADLVISDVDISRVYHGLIPGRPLPLRYATRPLSTSAIIFYWGIRRTSPQLDLHNILFTTDYRREFDALTQGTLADDLTVYIFISSKVVKADAPEGCENWFVMVNAPHDRGQDWVALRLKARSVILQKIQRVLGIDLTSDIVFEEFADPPLISQRTGSGKGALYGIASNDPMSAFMRHPNQVRNFKNLYFVGGSVHPGGGIPLCLASAQIVDKLIK